MQIAGSRGLELAERPQESSLTPEHLRGYCMGEVFAYLSRRVTRREDAEDMALEVFVAAYQSATKAPASEARAWLFGIARRKLADYLRKRSRRPETLETETGGLPNLPDNHDPNKAYLSREAVSMLRSIVESLPPEQREAIQMQHLEDLSILEIAVVMEKSPAAINSLLQRARTTIYNRGKNYFLEPHEVTQ